MVPAIKTYATTSTGLNTTAHVLPELFKPATKEEKKQAASVTVEYSENLNDYNYRVTPEMCFS